MGCSPSKGKLFSKPGLESPNAAADEDPRKAADAKPPEVEVLKSRSDGTEELPPSEELPEEEVASVRAGEDVKETEAAGTPREADVDAVESAKKAEKRKKNKDKRRAGEKQRRSSIVHAKFDFPPHMVRAHQAAYAFLCPNISRYEALLGLLDQAAQTQLSLQPMMTALVLRFEEVNQALEDMAEEGELMLKEHGEYMSLPSGMTGPAVSGAKLGKLTEPPPDLIQQLLRHSTEKMRQVGGSVRVLGDTTLEDAVEYFSSLSQMLVRKLRAKQTAEQRLTQVLARVGMAANRKGNPEDTALHSEDSGIGGENESLTGSERHRRHRGSAGSGSCGSGVNVRGAYETPGNLPHLGGRDEDGEEDEEDDDEEEEEEEAFGRKRSNSSPPDPSQTLLYLRAKYTPFAVKRPSTAGKPEPSSSGGYVNLVTELQNSQRDLDQRMKTATFKGGKKPPGHDDVRRPGLRRHSSGASGAALKGTSKSQKSSAFAPHPPKHQSVRRLINTFSQGTDGRPGQSLANVPPHIRRTRKSGSLLSSDAGNPDDGVPVVNGNNNNNSWPDGKDDCDVDSLPPPPPEVLLDNSFQSSEGTLGNEQGSEEDSVRLPAINQRTGASGRLKACVPNVEVLPNRASVRPKPGDAAAPGAQNRAETELNPDTEKANSLYQQARKIIHLRNGAEALDKRNEADHSLPRGRSGLETNDDDASPSGQPWTAPPVSRVRIPPSFPSVSHRFASPPVCRPPSRPSSPKTVVRANASGVEDIVPSVSFKDARSVFCQKEVQNPQGWSASGSSVLPRPWGEASRGRASTRGADADTRRTQSEQRPGGSHAPQAKEREPRIARHRLSDVATLEGRAQPESSAAT